MKEESKNNPTTHKASRDKSPIAEREPTSAEASDGQGGKSKIALQEEAILKFWQDNKIFEKSLEKDAPKGEFVFYDGPATANAKPVFHTMEPFSFKDIIPRYKTMKGFHVRRKGGWDTHGLPVELQIEKKLGFTSKKDIENYGIAAFNKLCRESVWEFIKLWKDFTKRMGYWADQDNAYVTYHNSYIESVWNVLKRANDEKLLYKDYKVVPWCPRCGTALSSHELAQGYADAKDLSVYVKFHLKPEQKFGKYETKGNAYLLAWTTTPWTLLGNVALAVGERVKYTVMRIKGMNELLIVASDLMTEVFKGNDVEIIHEDIFGEDLVGLEYEPLYDFMQKSFGDKNEEAFQKAYKVYPADFVNTGEGTGIVHTAVMYGQDDFVLGTKIGLPKFHTVDDSGLFISGTGFLEGKFVRDEETSVGIIKDLAHRNLLFKKEKYEHSYPFCWRCKTPLIYYARDSWYIRMSELRNKLVKENESINWEPAHIKEGRFGEWLREIKDWAISRERYWGTPLPVWQDKEGNFIVIGSIEDLKEKTKKSGNKYFVMRHGEAESNINDTINFDYKNVFHLTKQGKQQVRIVADDIKSQKFDLIITSPLARCIETASILAQTIGLDESYIEEDGRLSELVAGDYYEGKQWSEYGKFFRDTEERFTKAPEQGETLTELSKRVGDFIYELESKYSDKNILIVTHEAVITALRTVSVGASLKEAVFIKNDYHNRPKYADFSNLNFIPLPHNENYELDLHKPYIDELKLVDKNGIEMVRSKEVMDVWLDSGAMPFAQDHYPFSISDKELLYPADFIAEAIDQTRGWFYTLHAVGVVMGEGAAYKNVVCLGHILDANGKKMSKSVGNIVDPWVVIDKYGADALRLWMYSINQPGDSKNFDEKTVDELIKKAFNIIENILNFYILYGESFESKNIESENILDIWIVSRLNKLLKDGTDYLDKYKIFESSRLIRDFANDFSTWYLRRSRERFKSKDTQDKRWAIATTRFVLLQLATYMAPFTPFFAEHIYQKLKEEKDPESVHLCEWPDGGGVDEEVLENMKEVRKIVSLALEKRMSAEIKVRQPLNELRVKNSELEGKEEYLQLVKDEVNIKNIVFDENIEEEVELDTEITEELQKEGNVREFIRAVQDLRKDGNLAPSDPIVLQVETNETGKEFLNSVLEQVKKPTNISDIKFEKNDGYELKITDFKLKIEILKID